MTNTSLIAIAALLLLNVLAAAHVPRSWTYPPILLAAVWGATLVVYALHGDDLYPLGAETALGIVLGVGSFSLGGWGALSAADPTPRPPGGAQLERRSARWILWVGAIGLPFFARQILVAGADGVTGNLLVDARFAAIEDTMQGRSGPLAYLVPLVIFGTALHLLRIVKTTRLQTAAMVVLCVAYTVLTAGRFFFLVLFAIVAGGAAVQGRARASTVLVVGGGAFLAVFGAMAYLLDKGVDDGGEAITQTLKASLATWWPGWPA